MGGGQGSGPSHPDGVGPLGVIHSTLFLLWPPVCCQLSIKYLKDYLLATSKRQCLLNEKILQIHLFYRYNPEASRNNSIVRFLSNF